MSDKIEWMTAEAVTFEYDDVRDAYGNEGTGLVIDAGTGCSLVIEGTPEQIHNMLLRVGLELVHAFAAEGSLEEDGEGR